MWVDKGLYWAWKAEGVPFYRPPTEKQVEYATLVSDNGVVMRLAVSVSDVGDERTTRKPINRSELNKMIEAGWKLKYDVNSDVCTIHDKDGYRIVKEK